LGLALALALALAFEFGICDFEFLLTAVSG